SQVVGGICIAVRAAGPPVTATFARLVLDTCIRGIDDIGVPIDVGTVTMRNIAMQGVLLDADTVPQTSNLTGVTIEDAGMEAVSTSNQATLNLSGSSLMATGPAVGLHVGGESLVLRGTTIVSPGGAGVQIAGAGAMDLADAGNVIMGGPFALDDARPPRATADGPIILLTGAHLNGMTFAPGTNATGPAESNPPFWNIQNMNNRLAF